MDFTTAFPMLLQMGSTGAVIFIVIVFLNHIKEEAKLRIETYKSCETKLIEVIQENTKGFAELKEIIRQKVT